MRGISGVSGVSGVGRPASQQVSAEWNGWARWWVFNGVGVAGFVVQLGVLAALNRVLPGHYLAATAVAVELTLLFNFALHLRFTWRDRAGSVWGQLVRFHVSNGLISMAGNLLLMRWLVGAGMRVLTANVVAVVCCSVVNFVVADWWAFRGGRLAQAR